MVKIDLVDLISAAEITTLIFQLVATDPTYIICLLHDIFFEVRILIETCTC